MLVTAFSSETVTDSKASPYSCQVKSKAKLHPPDIFSRILDALGAKNAPEVGRKMGITKQAVYDWQKNTPSLENLLWISETSNTSLNWLLTGAGQRQVDSERSASFDALLEARVRAIVRDELQDIGGEVSGIEAKSSKDFILALDMGTINVDEEAPIEEEEKRKTG